MNTKNRQHLDKIESMEREDREEYLKDWADDPLDALVDLADEEKRGDKLREHLHEIKQRRASNWSKPIDDTLEGKQPETPPWKAEQISAALHVDN